jgi:hypothetical protein
MRYPDYYSDFWTRFRAMNPTLATGSGWKRKPEDVNANYDGARSGRWNNVYCHVGFAGAGGHRRLMAEWYESDRRLPEWTDFLAHVAGLNLPFALVVENDADKLFERRRAYLTDLLSADDMRTRRDELLKSASEAYRILLPQIRPR